MIARKGEAKKGLLFLIRTAAGGSARKGGHRRAPASS